jgi:hypothetical protein
MTVLDMDLQKIKVASGKQLFLSRQSPQSNNTSVNLSSGSKKVKKIKRYS